MFVLGNDNISKLYFGDTEIKRAYVGNALVFEGEKKPSRLPEGYTELRYIESPGGVYLLSGTGIGATNRMEIDIELLETPSDGGTNHYIAYCTNRGNGSTSSKFRHKYMVVNYTATYIGGAIHWYESTSTLVSISKTQITTDVAPRRMNISIDYNAMSINIDGTAKSFSVYASYKPSASVRLLGSSSKDTTTVKAKLYAVKVYDSAGEILKDFVPCVNQDGEAGLYELVNNSFIAGSVSGVLIAGPAV